ncbi:hypothetical protein Hdeb2414_s0010g00329731 [Helianthus debilis subsp. tardiflorus]
MYVKLFSERKRERETRWYGTTTGNIPNRGCHHLRSYGYRQTADSTCQTVFRERERERVRPGGTAPPPETPPSSPIAPPPLICV